MTNLEIALLITGQGMLGIFAVMGLHLPLKKAAQPPFSMLKNAGLSPAFLK